MPSQATLSLLIELKDNASKGLDSITSSLGTLGTIAGGVALAGVAAFGAVLASGVADAREAKIIMAQTEQTIKTMGNAAGVSAEHVADFASSLSDAAGMSLFGDDQIQAATNMLLTFSNIKGATLDLATTLSTDMAQALKSTPEAMSKVVGKILNSADAMAAAKKMGVSFTDEQIKLGKAMFESGNIAGYQALVMKELNAEFGGQAEAAAKAAGGMVQFKARLGEAAETMGTALLPALDMLGGFLNTTIAPALEAGAVAFGNLISAFQTGASEGGGIIGGLSNALYSLGGISPIFVAIGDAINDLAQSFEEGGIGGLLNNIIYGLTGIQGVAGPVVDAFSGLAATFTDAQTPVQGLLNVLTQISPTFAIAQAGITAAIGPIQDIILTVFGIISGFITEHGAKIQSDLTAAWQQVQAIIQGVVPPIQSIIASIFGAIATFLHAHGAEIQAFLGQTWDAIAEIINVALQIIQATIVPVITAIAGFIAAHSKEIQALLSAAWTIISNVIDAALTIIKGVLTAALQIIKGDWAGAWETIKTMATDVWENIKAIVGAAIEAVKIELSMAWDIIKGDVLAAWEAIKGAVTTALDGLVSAIEALPGQVVGVGAAVVQTIWDGLKGKWDELIAWFNSKLEELRNMLPFSEPKDTSSPLYGLAESGAAVIDMLVSGMQAAGGALPDTMAALGGDTTTALGSALDDVRAILGDSDLPGQAASLGESLMGQLGASIESGASGVLGTIASVGASIRSALEEMTRGTGATAGGLGSLGGGAASAGGSAGGSASAGFSGGGFAGGGVVNFHPNSIVVNAAAGQNERQIAEVVIREIDRKMRSKK